MKKNYCMHGYHPGLCVPCAYPEVEKLRAEVRDLRARLKAARLYVNHPYAKDPDNMEHWTVAFDRATDLRRRTWRKP